MVAIAAVDAVRGRNADEPPSATPELEERDALVDQLARLGARGDLLLYSDGCRVQRLAVPSLERTGDDQSGCAPRGAESPDRAIVARCLGEEVELFAGGGFVRSLPGCAPAWQPNGTLTFARNRQVVTEDGRVLIGRQELVRAARQHPTVPETPIRVLALIESVAWLSQSRAAVQLSIRVSGRLAGKGALSEIAFFENGRLAGAQPYFRTTGGHLAASPRGTYVTQTPDVILRQDGTQVSLPQHLRDAHAFAWSPDERFVALATRFAITILDVASLDRYDTIGSGLRSVTLPVRVTELAWR